MIQVSHLHCLCPDVTQARLLTAVTPHYFSAGIGLLRGSIYIHKRSSSSPTFSFPIWAHHPLNLRVRRLEPSPADNIPRIQLQQQPRKLPRLHHHQKQQGADALQDQYIMQRNNPPLCDQRVCIMNKESERFSVISNARKQGGEGSNLAPGDA